MLIEKIKPIPKYIEKQIITKYEQSNYAEHYYSYLTKNDGELVEMLVAVKPYKGNIYKASRLSWNRLRRSFYKRYELYISCWLSSWLVCRRIN